jgi:branched-chain amino acid transport system substrate-binding protein
VRSVAVAAAAALVMSACGARVPPYLGSVVAGSGPTQGQQAAGGVGAATGNSGGTEQSATPGANSGGGISTATLTGGGSAGGGSSGASPSTSAGGGTSGGSGASSVAGPVTPATLTPATFSYDPQVQASYCTGTTGNTASAPGVTPTSILAGNVSGLTGAVSDSFTPGYQAVQAVFDAINRYGGICGRQLQLKVEDDQQNSSTNNADVEALIPQVLAFVGSLSDADNGGVAAMEAAGTPDLGPAINTNRSNAPVYWSATGGSVVVRNGRALIGNGWVLGLKQYGDLPSSIAILSYSIPISAQAGQEFATVFQDEGVHICYSNYSIPPAPGLQMSSIVTTMAQDGCQGVYTTMDVVGNADMLRDMQQQGYHPKLISTTYEGYTPDQISLAGNAAAQGLDVNLSSVPLTSSAPGIGIYTSEMNTYEPGQPLTEFGLEAWADAELYVYALLKAGRNPTRASLTSALAAVSNWTSDGTFGAYTPSNRTGAPCSTNVVYQGDAFVETWPSSGLYCNNQFVDVGPADG